MAPPTGQAGVVPASGGATAARPAAPRSETASSGDTGAFSEKGGPARSPADGDSEAGSRPRRSLGDEDGGAAPEDADLGQRATRMASHVSIAEQMSLPHEILFVFVICLAQLFTQAGLGNTIAILHVIGDHYGITEQGDLVWLIAGYSLTVGTFILFSGRLGDLYGYKRMFLIGMAWYAVWSAVCGLAAYADHVLFTFARVLQGIGPALSLTNGLALFGASYAPGRRKAIVFAFFGGCAPGGSILGAAFAGLFALGWWPWTYWCFALVLAAVVALGYWVIPSVPAGSRDAADDDDDASPRGFWAVVDTLDLPGALTGITGLVLVNFAWNQAPINGWDAPLVYVLLIVGVLFVAGFFVIEIHYARHPLIPFDALSSDVSFVLAAMACGWGSFGIWIWYTWQFFSESRGASPLLATAWFSPVTISGLCAALFTGFLIHRLGPAVVMMGALCAFTVGTVLMATCPVDQTYWAQTFVTMIVMPWGMDMSFPAATLILSNAVQRKHQGIAASLVNTVVNYSISLALGFAGTVEYQVNNGGRTAEDKLKGFRGGFYLAIGLAGLGIGVCIAFLFKAHRPRRSESGVQEKA